jgi:hypothetical protein
VRARGSLVAVALCLASCVSSGLRPLVEARVVRVHGTVFDSLTFLPLRGAQISFSRDDSTGNRQVSASMDTSGNFSVILWNGVWSSQIRHERFDSLRVTLPVRRITVPDTPVAVVELWTPSRVALGRVLCGDSAKSDDAAVVGHVRSATTNTGIDSARVHVKWVNLTLKRGGFARSTESHETRTTRDGWYVLCQVPANGTLVAWAEYQKITTGAVPVVLDGAPARVDFSLDPAAVPFRGSMDLDPDSTGASLFPLSVGTARYRVLARDMNNRPVLNARVRMFGRQTVRTNAAGEAKLDSLSRGTQTLEVVAIGFQPRRRVVNVTGDRSRQDTVVLTSLRSLLDTVRIIAGADPTGFDRRRLDGRAGQFIAAADVERENPAETSRMLRTRAGVRYTFDRKGYPLIEVTTQTSPCKPFVLVDGFPPGPVPTFPGDTEMDSMIRPDEIGGVEIYTNPASVPVELRRFAFGPVCGAIVFWTREKLGVPRSKTVQP